LKSAIQIGCKAIYWHLYARKPWKTRSGFTQARSVSGERERAGERESGRERERERGGQGERGGERERERKRGGERESGRERERERVPCACRKPASQGYLAHQKPPPPETLQ
jgi:hypothetical protein